jgi:ribosomal protein L31E
MNFAVHLKSTISFNIPLRKDLMPNLKMRDPSLLKQVKTFLYLHMFKAPHNVHIMPYIG